MALELPAGFEPQFEECLRCTYFRWFDPAYLASDAGREDVRNHVSGRMLEIEERVVPWVGDVFDLSGAVILEIGCGTGSSTIPFARRALSVTACDLSGESMLAARERATALSVRNVDFIELDPRWARSADGRSAIAARFKSVDVVLLIAVLEHFTIDERIGVLDMVWNLLRAGGIIVIYETPNRLGWFDWHSFQLPFFDALPDELALLYAKKSPRPFFGLDASQALPREQLYRLGRGVSYHEFDLAIGLNNMEVLADSYSPHLSHRSALRNPSYDRALWETFDSRLPHVHPGFACPSLDLVIRKTSLGAAASHGERALPRILREDESGLRAELEFMRARCARLELELGSNTQLARRLALVSLKNALLAVTSPRLFANKAAEYLRSRMATRDKE